MKAADILESMETHLFCGRSRKQLIDEIREIRKEQPDNPLFAHYGKADDISLKWIALRVLKGRLCTNCANWEFPNHCHVREATPFTHYINVSDIEECWTKL